MEGKKEGGWKGGKEGKEKERKKRKSIYRGKT